MTELTTSTSHTSMTKTITLGEIASVFNGKTPAQGEQRSSGHPVLKIKDVDENRRFKNHHESFIDQAFLKKYGSKAIHTKDVLILNAAHSSTHVGSKIYFAEESVAGAIATGEWTVIRGTDKVVPELIHYFLQSVNGKGQLKELVKGIHLYPKDVANVQIPLPPLPEQRRIAALLDRADALRQKDRQLLAHYDKLAQSLFLDLFGDDNTEARTWTETTVDALSNGKGSMRTGPFGSDLLHSEFVDEGIFVLGIDNVVNNRFEWAKPRFITEEKYVKLKRYTVYPGDILISIMGTTGRTAVVPEGIPEAINSKHLAAITLNRRIADPTFLSLSLLYNDNVRQQLAAQNKGAIMDGLNLGIIKNLKIKLPPLSLQTHFAQLVEQIERQKAVVRQQMAASEALFGRLLQESFE